MFTRKIGFLLLILLVVLSGCASQAINQAKDYEQEHEPVQDILEETAGLNELPPFLTGQSDRVINIYVAAAKFPDLLENIPSFSDERESLGHTSLLNCFIDKINPDGSVVWSDHATKNKECLDIAAKAIYDFSVSKKTIKEIK